MQRTVFETISSTLRQHAQAEGSPAGAESEQKKMAAVAPLHLGAPGRVVGAEERAEEESPRARKEKHRERHAARAERKVERELRRRKEEEDDEVAQLSGLEAIARRLRKSRWTESLAFLKSHYFDKRRPPAVLTTPAKAN